MTPEELYERLEYVSAARLERQKMANLILEKPILLETLLQIGLKDNDPIGSRAMWVLEFVLDKKLSWILPHIDVFLKKAGKLQLDSSKRPAAKICHFLVEAYFIKKDKTIKQGINTDNLNKITELCFDWLINPEKVAVKAYSMRSLFLLGRQMDWIHPELNIILEQQMHAHSAAYKARARMILRSINKSNI